MNYGSTITIKGLTRIQANTLAILAEEGKLAEFLGTKLHQTDFVEEATDIGERDMPSVDYIEDDFDDSHHIIEYDA